MPVLIPLATFFEIAGSLAAIGTFFSSGVGLCTAAKTFEAYDPKDLQR